ncbi:predicted protein [Botrytis cinerea T4]|uniref:Uncharacterized protein n=1 Tax=Botryotinia fuckeliana (strain T4) TaxID=999810 RepID=G2XUU4_BOTF4|nr:predicted protein [Botrytis cinerea T4]
MLQPQKAPTNTTSNIDMVINKQNSEVPSNRLLTIIIMIAEDGQEQFVLTPVVRRYRISSAPLDMQFDFVPNLEHSRLNDSGGAVQIT